MLSIVRIGRRGTLPCVDAAQAAAWLERWPDLELLPLLLHVRFTAPGHLCKVRQKSGGCTLSHADEHLYRSRSPRPSSQVDNNIG